MPNEALEQALPAEPSSAAAARRITEDALRAWRYEDLVDVATLLVSELVTNAVLHAGSQIALRVAPTEQGVRVEVADASQALPSRRSYGREATIGRGLALVATLSSAWGIEKQAAGKVVWFQVGAGGPVPGEDGPLAAFADASPQAGEASVGVLSPRKSPVDDVVTVALLGLPVQLYRATAQYDEALLRERALLDLQLRETSDPVATAAGTQGGASAAPLTARLPLDHPGVEVQLAEAEGREQPTVDLQVDVAREARDACAELLVVLDEADELSRYGGLLLPPALPEIRACRRWYLGELIGQLDGERPTAWAAPDTLGDVDESDVDESRVTVPAADVVLDSLHDAVVASDHDNRIVYANPAAERLLGWRADELVGHRITMIVPPHLREAHVVGYSHYLVTGVPRLLGRPVRVPALRRDGSEVPVELVLSAVHRADGRPLFVGCLRDVSGRVERERTVTTDSALAAASEIAVLLGPGGGAADLAQVAPLVLAALGMRLGCQAAMLWVPDAQGHQLHCAAGWDDGSTAAAEFRSTSARRRFGPGVGVPGRVWVSRHPVWVADVVSDANFPRASLAVEHGLRSALAFPVLAGTQTRGVVELFSREVIDTDTEVLAVVAAIGRHLGAHTGGE